MSMAAAELQKAGLERYDAAVIAAVLGDQNSAASAAGLDKVRDLLTSGRLNEARQTAPNGPVILFGLAPGASSTFRFSGASVGWRDGA
jgi:hypothetical protein